MSWAEGGGLLWIIFKSSQGRWLFFDLGTGRRATAAETKLMAPPAVELFLCPVTTTSHTLGRIALEHGLAAWDSMAGLSLVEPPPPKESPCGTSPNPRSRSDLESSAI